jgi:hypothetical protein
MESPRLADHGLYLALEGFTRELTFVQTVEHECGVRAIAGRVERRPQQIAKRSKISCILKMHEIESLIVMDQVADGRALSDPRLTEDCQRLTRMDVCQR